MAIARREVIIRNKLGLHARPAMQFVELANRFASAVRVESHGQPAQQADGKSVMQMIILAAEQNARLTIHAEGDDAEEAARRLAELVESGFGEEC